MTTTTSTYAEAAYVAGVCAGAVLDRLQAKEGLTLSGETLNRITVGMYDLLVPVIQAALEQESVVHAQSDGDTPRIR